MMMYLQQRAARGAPHSRERAMRPQSTSVERRGAVEVEAREGKCIGRRTCFDGRSGLGVLGSRKWICVN
jgi:hypothetical protein